MKVACLRGRTSDRTAGAGEGAEALARELGGQVIGAAGTPEVRDWTLDVVDSRPVFAAAAQHVTGALERGELPVLTASDCSICIGSFGALAAARPDAHVAWIDAHGDFNTPDTTLSGFLGGMCLAAACGRWDAGWAAPALDPARVHLLGVRDLDPGEEREVAAAGLTAEPPVGVPLYVHLDTDVLDPSVMAAQFPVPCGWDAARLAAQLAELAADCEIVGVEITALEDQAALPAVLEALRPLLA